MMTLKILFSKSGIAFLGIILLMYFRKDLWGADQHQRTRIDSLKHVLDTSQPDTVIAQCMYRLGQAYNRVDSDTTLLWAEKLIKFSEEKNLREYVAKAFILKANIYRFAKEPEKSRAAYRRSLIEFEAIKDYGGIAVAYGCLMKGFIMQLGPKDSVEYYFGKTISLKDSVKSDRRPIADAYFDYSSYLTELAEYHLAMDYIIKGIQIYDETKDEKRLLFANISLALIYRYLNNYDKSISLLEDVAPRILKAKSYSVYPSALLTLGDCYYYKKEYKRAQDSYRSALFFSDKYNVRESTDMMYTGLAAVKLKMNYPDSALFFASKALEIANVTPGYNHKANLQLARAYMQKGDFVNAEKYAKGFLNYSLNQKIKRDATEAYDILAELCEKSGKYKKACEYYNLGLNLKDTLYGQENASKMADMEAWYWSTQKQNELALAKKNEELRTNEVKEANIENQLYASQRNGLIIAIVLVIIFSILLYRINLQRRKNKLMQRVAELELKAIRAQMNPHFLFNALSAIQMLINKNDIKQSNIALAKFGKLMRLILENSEKPTISLGDEIKTLQLYIELESLRFPFNYNLEIDSMLDKENTEIPSMIIQPYVENAIKHGISTKTTDRNVNITLKRMDNHLFCTIEDDGVGREVAEAGKSKYAQHKSMGTKLSKDRLDLIGKQMAGKAEVIIKDLYTKEGSPSGTRVELSIPINYYAN